MLILFNFALRPFGFLSLPLSTLVVFAINTWYLTHLELLILAPQKPTTFICRAAQEAFYGIFTAVGCSGGAVALTGVMRNERRGSSAEESLYPSTLRRTWC